MPSLFHYLDLPDANPEHWVKASSLRRILADIGRADISIGGMSGRKLMDGVQFSPAQEEAAEPLPWEVTASASGLGFTVGVGYVTDLYLSEDGSDLHIPKINGDVLEDENPPVLSYRPDGVIAVELRIRFLRGAAPLVPYSPLVELGDSNPLRSAWPEIKWLTQIQTTTAPVDSNPSGYGVFAMPIAQVTNGRPRRLRWSHITPAARFVTTFAA